MFKMYPFYLKLVLLLINAIMITSCLSETTYNHTVCVIDPPHLNPHDGDGCSIVVELLQNITSHLQNSTDVVIYNSINITNASIMVERLNSFRIRGTSKTIRVCCIRNVGFVISSSQDIHIANITLVGCGTQLVSFKGMFMDTNTVSSIFIINTMNIHLTKVIVSKSQGKGLTFSNTYGNVTIANCTFMETGLDKMLQDGGGVYIRFHTSSTTLTDTLLSNINSHYKVENSLFVRNRATSKSELRKGGGLLLNIINGNRIKVMVINCTFKENVATYGGGTHIVLSSQSSNQLNNSISFVNCRWINNSAYFGAAVDIIPKYGKTATLVDSVVAHVIPLFMNCSFHSNRVFVDYQTTSGVNTEQYSPGRGSFIANGVSVDFHGNTTFVNNNGSALRVTSGIVRFGEHSNVTFINNTGSDGGAIDLVGLSSMIVKDNSQFSFINNTAILTGGGISYYVTDSHQLGTLDKCFIEYDGSTNNTDERNLSFLFDGNLAGKFRMNGGHSIFATSFQHCFFRYTGKRQSNLSADEILTQIGNFNIIEKKKELGNEISTAAVRFLTNFSETSFKVIPGKTTPVPFIMQDEFGHKMHSFYHLNIQGNSNISLSEEYLSDNRITFHGDPGSEAQLKVYDRIGIYGNNLIINIYLKQCPPGYTLVTDRGFKRCVCSARTEMFHTGIRKCDISLFQAYLHRTYWVGYKYNESESDKTLLTARCPPWFCQLWNSTALLPQSASRKRLEKAVCNKNRQGYLCGKCKVGFSATYHSTTFFCVSNTSCKYGQLLYIVLELLPVTVLFLVVIIFDLRFTSGSTYSFIFFAQVISALNIQAGNVVWFAVPLYCATNGHRFIYRLFTLDFLLDYTNFCLWKDATTLDMLAFQYVTIVYSLALVLITVTLINKCNVRRIMCRCCIRIRRTRTLRGSIIHGLTAFLILCYWKCTQVSFMLLKPACLSGPGDKCNYGRRVFYYGETVMFGSYHLKYAIPAFCFIFTIVSIPPVLLLVHPLFYRVYALAETEDSKCVRTTCKYFPMDTLKPLLDSFQGCFKDRYRCFSSFYFFYRLFILISHTFTFRLSHFYFLAGIQLVVILVIHAIIQPYKKRWHNNLDALLLANLIIINGMTIYNFSSSSSSRDYYVQTQIVGTIQVMLIYLPILYMLSYSVAYLSIKFFHVAQHKTKVEEDTLPPLIVNNRTSENDCRYDKFYEEAL